jgi:hypothetical protein
MDAIEHSIIATTLLAVFYYAGMWVDKRNRIEEAIANTLATLEDNNYIICEEDEDGQKVLQEVVRKPETL